jgi:hypothetical protein
MGDTNIIYLDALHYQYSTPVYPPRSVSQILKNPARLAYEFKIEQERDTVRFNLTMILIEAVLNEKP